MRGKTYIAGAATVLAVAAAAVLVGEAADNPPAAAFTAEQAAAGKAAYARSCAGCHMPDLSGNNDVPQLSGTLFRSSWGTRSTKDLIEYLSATMPPEGPKPEADAYVAISAYILQANGATTGDEPLTGATAIPLNSLLPAR